MTGHLCHRCGSYNITTWNGNTHTLGRCECGNTFRLGRLPAEPAELTYPALEPRPGQLVCRDHFYVVVRPPRYACQQCADERQAVRQHSRKRTREDWTQQWQTQ